MSGAIIKILLIATLVAAINGEQWSDNDKCLLLQPFKAKEYVVFAFTRNTTHDIHVYLLGSKYAITVVCDMSECAMMLDHERHWYYDVRCPDVCERYYIYTDSTHTDSTHIDSARVDSARVKYDPGDDIPPIITWIAWYSIIFAMLSSLFK